MSRRRRSDSSSSRPRHRTTRPSPRPRASCSPSWAVPKRARHANRSRFILRITTTNGVMDEATLQPMEPLIKPKSSEADYAMLDWHWGVFKARRAVFFDQEDRDFVCVHPDCLALERSKSFQEWAWCLLKQARIETAQSYDSFSL